MNNIRDEVKELGIGFKVRGMRQERRMTLQDMAEASGLSKPLLSQIENEQVIPPLATLLRIAKAFNVPLQTFFQETDVTQKCILVRAEERRKKNRRLVNAAAPPPYSYHSLAYGKMHRHMEPFLVEFEVQEWDDELLVSHEGEEFLFVLEGEIELRYGDQTMMMGPGDSVYYDSTEPHGYVVKGPTRPRAVAVLYSR